VVMDFRNSGGEVLPGQALGLLVCLVLVCLCFFECINMGKYNVVTYIVK
jgi:hypothetical protein